MTQHTSRGGLAAGIFFVIVGAVFLAAELGAWRVRAAYLFPLLLIGVGVAVLLGRPARAR